MKQLIKTATYSVMHMSVAISVAYILTGDIAIALGIGLIEPFVQTFFYHMHEHLWSKAGVKVNPNDAHAHHHGNSIIQH